ncbi:amidase [Sphingobium sp. H39-3-25]|uniref:amidase n=1 Tax=Sphingobium arseniciresistens TaxID=3030834 RepID=UPI0023B9C3D4|nr:amidase [Sphingobium arseniciresistens]
MSTPKPTFTEIAARDRLIRGWAHLSPQQPERHGPLEGVTVGVKDVIDVAGMPTTHGSPVFRDNIASYDAEAVRRLRAAGAVILGKTVTAEFAAYSPGPTVNPRDPARTPGGSSSGSAAVIADGQADLALGTQTAGSIIRPASYCGVLGFKPSFGRYPLEGVLTTAPSLDTLGLFARSLDLLIAADAVLSDEAALPPAAKHPVIGLCRSPAWPLAEENMRQALFNFADRLRMAGFTVIEHELPAAIGGVAEAQKLIHRREAWIEFGKVRQEYPDLVSDVFRDFIDAGAADTPEAYRAALALQRDCVALLPQLFSSVDLLLVPAAIGVAPLGLGATGDPAFQRIWTALGVPCLAFPARWTNGGLPLGLQLIGLRGDDRQLLANAATILAQTSLAEA